MYVNYRSRYLAKTNFALLIPTKTKPNDKTNFHCQFDLKKLLQFFQIFQSAIAIVIATVTSTAII